MQEPTVDTVGRFCHTLQVSTVRLLLWKMARNTLILMHGVRTIFMVVLILYSHALCDLYALLEPN